MTRDFLKCRENYCGGLLTGGSTKPTNNRAAERQDNTRRKSRKRKVSEDVRVIRPTVRSRPLLVCKKEAKHETIDIEVLMIHATPLPLLCKHLVKIRIKAVSQNCISTLRSTQLPIFWVASCLLLESNHNLGEAGFQNYSYGYATQNFRSSVNFLYKFF